MGTVTAILLAISACFVAMFFWWLALHKLLEIQIALLQEINGTLKDIHHDLID